MDSVNFSPLGSLPAMPLGVNRKISSYKKLSGKFSKTQKLSPNVTNQGNSSESVSANEKQKRLETVRSRLSAGFYNSHAVGDALSDQFSKAFDKLA